MKILLLIDEEGHNAYTFEVPENFDDFKQIQLSPVLALKTCRLLAETMRSIIEQSLEMPMEGNNEVYYKNSDGEKIFC